jgi:hypothetical protein
MNLTDTADGCYNVTFAAYLNEMAAPMDKDALSLLAAEVRRTQTLFRALGWQTYTPTYEEWDEFMDWLVVREGQSQSGMGMTMH